MSFDLSTSSVEMNEIFITSENRNDVMRYVYASLDGSIYDIATVVHFLYRDMYKIAKLKSRVWYVFDGMKWRPSEVGPYYKLSTNVVQIYETFLNEEIEKKAMFQEQLDQCTNEAVDDDVMKRDALFYKNSLKTSDRVILSMKKIIEKLKNVKSKESVCRECSYLFYDPEFITHLDTNPHLICFSNGVLDLETNMLRQGRSSDNISISIKMNFTIPKTKQESVELSKILDEFQTFRSKITTKRQNKLLFVV